VKFTEIQETDQVAVIHLARSGATVDMFIAIDGIPAGQTVTYILPFWHKPDHFALEEMESHAFRSRYVRPAIAQLSWDSMNSSHPALYNMLPASTFVGSTVFGPFSPVLNFPAYSTIRAETLTGEQRNLGITGGLSSYQIVSTANAKAELYQVEEQDLQALLARVGLPLSYADVLRKYQTQYFAVMHLTGTQAGDQPGKALQGRGVHYSFQHVMAESNSYTYTYPLGTGGAWPTPILLTDIFITCEPGWTISATAPTIGRDNVSYADLLAEIRQGSSTSPATASLNPEDMQYPTAWHRGYFFSNPTDDIVVEFSPRPDATGVNLAELMTRRPTTILLALVSLLIAWGVAARLVIRPMWRWAGCPGVFSCHVLQYFGVMSLIGLLSGALLLQAPAMLIGADTNTTFQQLAFGQDRVSSYFMLILCGVVVALLAKWIKTLRERWQAGTPSTFALTLIPVPVAAIFLALFAHSVHLAPGDVTGFLGSLLLIISVPVFVLLATINPGGKLPVVTPILTWVVVAVCYGLFTVVALGLASGADLMLMGASQALNLQ
jgi:hypothetical protein